MSSKKPTTGSSASRRDALRKQQEAEARAKRNRTVLAVVAGIVALAIIAIVGVVAWQDWKTKKDQREREAGVQVTPPNAVGKDGGILADPKAKHAKYTLDLYVDYQCPHCKDTEEAFGGVWKELMDEGYVKLVVHTMTFMNNQTRDDKSTQLAIGAACADTVGKYWDYHTAAYNHQQQAIPLYSQTDIDKTIPEEAGITGDTKTTFEQCVKNKSTAQFVRQVEEKANKDGVTSTPTLKVNGKNPKTKDAAGQEHAWWDSLTADKEAWKKAIAEAAASK